MNAPSKTALDQIQKHFLSWLELFAHDYLWWIGVVCYLPDFIDDHPDIVERKTQANIVHLGTLSAYED